MGKYGPNYCETNFANLPSKGQWIELHLGVRVTGVRGTHFVLTEILRFSNNCIRLSGLTLDTTFFTEET